MSNRLKGLSTERFFDYFEEISRIPRGSGNTRQISDYCMEFARAHRLEAVQDQMGNIYIRKEASPGREQEPGILLQGHLDMVTEQKPGSTIDMKTEGLTLQVEGDYISAADTTLGGDDGIAIAYALSILDDAELSHPMLEVIFTVDEEIGLLGAQGMELPAVQAKYMLNLDSEEHGVLWAGCAGGMTALCQLPVVREGFTGRRAVLRISGLIGGHSGTEIDKERGNAVLLLGTVLRELKQKCLFAISDLHGGLKDNAIPRDAEAVLLFDLQAQYLADTGQISAPDAAYTAEKMREISERISELETEFRSQYVSADPDISLLLEWQEESYEETCDFADTDKLIFFLNMVPNGIQHMEQQIPGLVETSLNLGVFRMASDRMEAYISVRSSVDSRKRELGKKLACLIEMLGGDYSESGDYPGWKVDPVSHLRDEMCRIYEELFGTRPKVAAVHAGLECGYFKEKYPWLDIISFGPDILNIHTTEEKMSISSCNAMYGYLKRLITDLR